MMGPESSKTCSIESMWRDLPESVLEKVFTFLPIASVCRFRTLSKEWNRSISSPTFKHAGASSEEYALITSRWRELQGGWDVLDVAQKRYFTLSDAFLIKHVQREGLLDAAHRRFWTYLAAADGGLFCVWFFSTEENAGLFVCNPLLKTVKHLPPTAGAGWTEIEQTVVMATDRSSMEYEIFIVSTATEGETFEPESILVYESKTSRWRTAPYQPSSCQIFWGTLTIFNKNQYCIVNRGDSSSAGLASYDKETGVVSDLRGIHFPFAPGSHLVVSNTRLFCVIPMEDPVSVEIFEIDVVKRASTRLTQMPRALLIWVLGHDLKRRFRVLETKIKAATASADCILVASLMGRCAAYRRSQKSWHQFADDRIRWDQCLRDDLMLEESNHGSNHCLSLCAP